MHIGHISLQNGLKTLQKCAILGISHQVWISENKPKGIIIIKNNQQTTF